LINEFVIYDKAIHAWAKVLIMRGMERKHAPIVFAPPHRAHAALKQLLKLDPSVKRVPLPAMSVRRGEFTFDESRFHFNDRLIVNYPKPPLHTKVQVMKPWQPITIPYFIELWAYTQREALWMAKQMETKFLQQLAYIKVDLAEYGCKRLSIRKDAHTDISDYESAEADRSLRMTYNVTLSAAVLPALETRETVLGIDVDYRDLDTEDLIEQQEVIKKE
jgi:hypothetical protein